MKKTLITQAHAKSTHGKKAVPPTAGTVMPTPQASTRTQSDSHPRYRTSYKHELMAATEHVFGRSVDALLAMVVYMAHVAAPQPDTGRYLRAEIATERFLEHVNYDVIKHALATARKRKYIVTKRHALPAITKAGRDRLARELPRYEAERAWDGRIHMVTYDIPNEQKKARDLLRLYLKRIGCSRLQESVWVTAYNPIDTLRDFIREHDLDGTVVVSDLGKDASVGEETMVGVLWRIYSMETINKRYEEWLGRYGYLPKGAIGLDGVFAYLPVLKDDPQLPFAILPPWWKGTKAYNTIKPYLDTLMNAVDGPAQRTARKVKKARMEENADPRL